MQSGITVSAELHSAFSTFVSTPAQRGLLLSIERETILPRHVLPSSTPDFHSDLSSLSSHLTSTNACYILLRRYQNAPDGYVAVTYIPDSAPVRQKMLYASTRLTLVRELGTERFRDSISVTEARELEAEGWKRREESGQGGGPLTEEEKNLKGIKEMEAEERGGTAGRRLETGGLLSVGMSDEARNALEGFASGGDNLLQLKINVATETIELAEKSSTDAERLPSTISATEPRYSFFKYSQAQEAAEQSPIVFIYTCPSGSKIKERMVYASTKQGFLSAASSTLGTEIAKKLEASNPSEITMATLEEEFRPKQESKQGFSRPKKPGKR